MYWLTPRLAVGATILLIGIGELLEELGLVADDLVSR